MSKKLYVGGLPYAIDDAQLKDLFTPYGEVASAKVIADKFTGQSKGFGFVEFVNAEDADKAVEGLHDKEVGGRKLTVNEARPMAPRSGGGGGFGGGGRRGGGGGGRDRDRRGGHGGDGGGWR